MWGRRHTIARLYSNFYREQFHKSLRWLIAMIFVMYLLIAAIIYLILFHPSQTHYANTMEGKILPMPKQLE